METVIAPSSAKYCKILIAKLAPSNGSVPEPNSSKRIRLFSVALWMIFTILLMCAENVLKDSLILC